MGLKSGERSKERYATRQLLPRLLRPSERHIWNKNPSGSGSSYPRTRKLQTRKTTEESRPCFPSWTSLLLDRNPRKKSCSLLCCGPVFLRITTYIISTFLCGYFLFLIFVLIIRMIVFCMMCDVGTVTDNDIHVELWMENQLRLWGGYVKSSLILCV